jgi:adenylyltransferase/sulfurtransferase
MSLSERSSESSDSAGTIKIELGESRYDRQQRLSWWDQELLSKARVLVVGAGALGNEVVKNLALVGVGNIVVIDGDVVESSNLARCIFFRVEDEGKAKATALAHRAGDVNPEVSITGVVGDVRSLGTGISLRADVVVGALDNREARLYLNRLAARTQTSWVDGAIEALSGLARVFTPPAVCYECTFTEADWTDLAHRQSCRLLSKDDLLSGKVPTTASTSSIVAGIEAQEVIKLIHSGHLGIRPLAGALVFDGANNDCYPLSYPQDPNCLAHHCFENPIRLELDSRSFPRLTIGELVTYVWPELSENDNAEIVVELGDDHVIGWKCLHCGDTAREHRPSPLIAWGDARCPICKETRQPEFVTSISVPGNQSWMTMEELGIRLDEILVVRVGIDERYIWLCGLDTRFPAEWSDISSLAHPLDHRAVRS